MMIPYYHGDQNWLGNLLQWTWHIFLVVYINYNFKWCRLKIIIPVRIDASNADLGAGAIIPVPIDASDADLGAGTAKFKENRK